ANRSCTGTRVGLVGQPCCTDSTCRTAAAACVAGTCVACGAVGQPCCVGSSCNPGTLCGSGICEACGLPGQRCCSGGSCNSTIAVCDLVACVSNNVWTAGLDLNNFNFGAVSNWNGTAWSNALFVQGFDTQVGGIWGSGPFDVWAVGDD